MKDDIYIVLPGITGSVLQRDGKDVFGLTAEAGLQALFSGGRSLEKLQVDLHAPPGERPDDGVTAARVAPDAHLIPGLWKIDGYGALGQHVRSVQGAVKDENYFEFPYDWRLDNRIAAHDLHAKVTTWLSARRRKHPEAKAVLLAHSMGGLVSRYYLEVLGGWRDTRALVTFGTPHRGSPNALDFLANGMRKAFGLVDLTSLVRSLPSVYQLLPIYRCVDLGQGELAYLTDVADRIPGIDRQAVVAARAFHQEIEDAVKRNAQSEEYVQNQYGLSTVIGAEHPTKQSAVLTPSGLEALLTYRGEDRKGDGTVPRPAASPMEWEDDRTAVFSGTRHGSLQNAPSILSHTAGWLGFADVDLSAWRNAGPVKLSVAVDDVYPVGEDIAFTVEPSQATLTLRYQLDQLTEVAPGPAESRASHGRSPVTGKVEADDGTNYIEIPAQPPGLYRLTVTGDRRVEPVSDLVLVAPR